MLISNTSLVAKSIREDLKKAFPNTKFKIRKTDYSTLNVQWNDLYISWDDVQRIVNKYQKGHYNGNLEDYEYTNLLSEITQVMYITYENLASKGW